MVTIGLSLASRARGLVYISMLLLFGWAAGVLVFLIEIYADWRLDVAYPLIDLAVVAGLLWRAHKPEHFFFDLTILLVSLMALQQVVRMGLTPVDLHWTLALIGNRLFEIMHIAVWCMAGIRIFRIHFPERFEKIFGPLPPNAARVAAPQAPSRKQNDKPEGSSAPNPVFANREPRGIVERLIYNLMADVADTDRLPEDHVKRPKEDAYGKLRKRGAVPIKPKE